MAARTCTRVYLGALEAPFQSVSPACAFSHRKSQHRPNVRRSVEANAANNGPYWGPSTGADPGNNREPANTDMLQGGGKEGPV
jgi:hypothetical protein